MPPAGPAPDRCRPAGPPGRREVRFAWEYRGFSGSGERAVSPPSVLRPRPPRLEGDWRRQRFLLFDRIGMEGRSNSLQDSEESEGNGFDGQALCGDGANGG